MKYDGANVYLTVGEFNKFFYALGQLEDGNITINFRNPDLGSKSEPYDKLLTSILWHHGVDFDPYINVEKGIYPKIEKIIISYGE